MLSDIQRRKLTKMWGHFDLDRDGVIERREYDRICGRLLDALRIDRASAEGAEVVGWYDVEWADLLAAADRSADGRVTLEVWLAYRDQLISASDGWEVQIEPYIRFTFDHLQQGGVVATADVHRYFALYGKPEEELTFILDKIDPARRGLTWERTRQLAWEYYMSSDADAPGSSLLGPF